MRRLIGIVPFIFLGSMTPDARQPSLSEQMKILGVREAILIASQAIDEEPVWAPSGEALGVNIEETWMRVELTSISLVAGTWRGDQKIGVLKSPLLASPLDDKTLQVWRKAAKFGGRKVEATNGTIVELRQEGLSTEFVITEKGGKPEVLWKSGLENCHSLALSPDERFVAFICELNGVVVAALEQ